MRLTEVEYADLMRKRPAAGEKAPPRDDRAVAASAEKPATGPKFKSKAEARYAQILEARKRAGEIADWDYEALTLVVGRAEGMVSRITPDFVVHRYDGTVELREVKGWLRDDARAKLLAAVRQWQGFSWWLVWARRGGFEEERL